MSELLSTRFTERADGPASSAAGPGRPLPVSTPAAASVPVSVPVTLQRRLGPIDAAAIVISNVIGGGIFFVPILFAQLVHSGWALLCLWVFVDGFAFAGDVDASVMVMCSQ